MYNITREPNIVTIEGVNLYSEDPINTEEIDLSIRIANQVYTLVQGQGDIAVPVWLLDNTIWKVIPDRASEKDPNRSTLYIDNHRRLTLGNLVKQHGWGGEAILEANYEEEGHTIIADLRNKSQNGVLQFQDISYELTNNGQGRYIKIAKSQEGRIKILGKHSELNEERGNAYPSCEILNVALIEDILSRSEISITVLPERFKGQQERTRTLLSLHTEQLNFPVINIFFSEENIELQHWDTNESTTAELAIKIQNLLNHAEN